MHVKICGLTRLDDARAALDAGADLLGFNFYPPSPRSLATDAATAIIACLRAEYAGRAFVTVGVFVNETPERVRAALTACGLDRAQLHGDETPAVVRDCGPAAYKALRPAGLTDAESWIAAQAALNVVLAEPAFLIDTSHPKLYGGSGQTGDWALARTLAARHPILLAGGLNPANVAAAVQAVRPWGVDTASGVESAPGIKDAAKMRAFVAAARAA